MNLDEPKVQIQVFARQNQTWYWRISVWASTMRLMGQHWCPQVSHSQVDGSVDNPRKAVQIAAGAIAEHQQEVYASIFEPTEIAKLAGEAYDELIRDLEKSRMRNPGALPFRNGR